MFRLELIPKKTNFSENGLGLRSRLDTKTAGDLDYAGSGVLFCGRSETDMMCFVHG